MNKLFVMLIAVILLLTAWLGAERRAPVLDLSMVTTFDFSRYPACGVNRTSYCIQAIRFYDADSGARLAEVPVDERMGGARRIAATLRLDSIPRHAYAVTLYRDSTGILKEGGAGEVSTFDDAGH